jgi:hypothetical protein
MIRRHFAEARRDFLQNVKMSSGSRLAGCTCLAEVSNACLKTTDFAEMFENTSDSRTFCAATVTSTGFFPKANGREAIVVPVIGEKVEQIRRSKSDCGALRLSPMSNRA